MPQLVKKRRSGWAVLAVGALVASILAVGATPAAATARKPDFEAQWMACLGLALADQGFTDVSMTGNASHYDNINCLAYYGITKGRTPESFAPDANVTRSQMALFLARAAKAAGIDLGEATDQGFMDVGMADPERLDAINLTVGEDIMFGDTETSFDPPSKTHFAPTDHVTRWEMAMFLFAFLNHALDEVMVDEWPKSVDGDDAGRVELGSEDGGRTGTRPDDYFGDARRKTPLHVDDRISATYELGITTGANNMVGPDGVFNPNSLVTRAQMASFIMRTLGHTNLRPAGLTSQSTNFDTMVSIRDADFKPVADKRTEVITTNFPNDAFDANGACIERFTRDQNGSFDECQIDVGDVLTNDDEGNALWEGVGLKTGNKLTIECGTGGTYTFKEATRGGSTDYKIYAWSGAVGEEANKDVLFESVPANVLTALNDATQVIVTGGVEGGIIGGNGSSFGEDGIRGDNGTHVQMGDVIEFTLQLADKNGSAVGPSPDAINGITVRIDTFTEQTVKTDDPLSGVVAADGKITPTAKDAWAADDDTRIRMVLEPDETGMATFSVRSADLQSHMNNADKLKVIYVGVVEGSELDIVDKTTPSGTTSAGMAALEAIRFSDNDSIPKKIAVVSEDWRLRGSRNRNTIRATVYDQYADLYRDGDHEITATDATNKDDFLDSDGKAILYEVSTTGRRAIGYTHGGEDPLEQIVVLQLQTPAVFETGVDGKETLKKAAVKVGEEAVLKVFWADRGAEKREGTGEEILLGDPASDHVVVNEENPKGENNPNPIAYGYGPDDKFVVEDEVVSIHQFEEVLQAKEIDLGDLIWIGYDYNRPRDGATWTIEKIFCKDPDA